jgi:hypothetical protein
MPTTDSKIHLITTTTESPMRGRAQPTGGT